MPYQVGDVTKYGWLEEVLCGAGYDPPTNTLCSPAEIAASGVKIMRYGGKTVNEHYVAPSSSVDPTHISRDQYRVMATNMKANGITPLLQVPYYPGQESSQDAAARAKALVTYINGKGGERVTYWSISNEPDLASGYNLPAGEIAKYFKKIARAMKEADPTILIAGPDLSEYNKDGIMTALTACGGPDDITGPILNLVTQWPPGVRHTPVYYVDILTFHTYPFDGTQTRDEVIAKAATPGTFADHLTELQGRINACNQHHNRLISIPLTMAVTEMHLGTDNPVPNDYAGEGNASFLAGQFWAEMMSLGMQKGLAFITFWSAISGDFGYMDHDGATNLKLPTYYHFQLLATHFRGAYAPLTELTVYNGSPAGEIKAFGAKDTNQVAVMILNQQSAAVGATPLSYTVRLDTTPIVGPSTDLQIHIDAGVASKYTSPGTAPLSPESTVLLLFNAQGVLTQKLVYTVDDAGLNQGPQSQ